MPHRFECHSNSTTTSTHWLIGGSKMARFSGTLGNYKILYKRGGQIEEIMEKTEWLITSKQATHVIVDGVQNSVRDIQKGNLKLERDVLPKLKALNKQAKVILAEILYCPQHLEYLSTPHMINRQIRRMNKEVSGMDSPQPWRALSAIGRDKKRRRVDTVEIFPGSYARDGYHINVAKILEYESILAAFMAAMVNDTQQ